jgi:hypothetical protein
MLLRRGTAADLPATADIYIRAFMDDPITSYVMPYRKEYPLSFRDYWLRQIKKVFYSPGVIMMVAIQPSQESVEALDGTGQVIGVSFWERCGTSDTARLARKTDGVTNGKLLSRIC